MGSISTLIYTAELILCFTISIINWIKLRCEIQLSFPY